MVALEARRGALMDRGAALQQWQVTLTLVAAQLAGVAAACATAQVC